MLAHTHTHAHSHTLTHTHAHSHTHTHSHRRKIVTVTVEPASAQPPTSFLLYGVSCGPPETAPVYTVQTQWTVILTRVCALVMEQTMN